MVSSGVDSNANVQPILVDADGRPYVILTDGTNEPIFETDDDDIAKDQITIVVINLNYVYDAVNTKWVRMTQP